MLWVYDLRSLDLDWWAAAAPAELAATVAPGDRVVMLVGDAALAARERLAQALQRAIFAAKPHQPSRNAHRHWKNLRAVSPCGGED